MAKKRSPTDSTTVDLSSMLDITETDLLQGSRARRNASSEIEANIILIAHPDDEMLGTRTRLGPDGTLTIGRSSSCDITLSHVRSLSRVHARLRHLGDHVEVEDLGSTNGTYVYDEPIEGAYRLRSGDRFQVGAVHFKFLHELDPEHAFHETIHQLVTHDGLTEIYNKRKFEEEFQREFDRARRHRRPLTLILFDIDRFKDVNDNFGHLCGDFVLQQIARRSRELVRPEQTLARLGGEEFGILSPESDVEGAEVLAEKLRTLFEADHHRYTDVDVKITCSFGVAARGDGMKEPSDLFEAADKALYRSKNEGRNRVTVHGHTAGSD